MPKRTRAGRSRRSAPPAAAPSPSPEISLSREGGLLLGILLLAAALRLTGVGWGLPGTLHRSSYHPDEWQAVNTALSMALRGGFNPHFFNYPTFHIYLVCAVASFATMLGLLGGLPGAYLLARLVSVVLGVATVVLTHRIGRRLGGEVAGLAAALLLAVLPLHVVDSRFATMDVPLTFWVTVALWAAVELAGTAGDAIPRGLLLRGAVAAGLAASTKYNGIAVVLPLLVAVAPRRGAWPAAGVALLTALATFALTSPYLFIDPAAPAAVRFELLEHPRQTNLFGDVGPGWWFHLRHNLPTAAGWLVAPAALAGLAWRRSQRGVWCLFAWLLVGLLMLLRTHELFIRYWLPLLPVLAVGAGLLVAAVAPAVADRAEQPDRPRDQRRWLAAAALLLLVGGMPLLRSRAYAALLAGPEPRDEAARWCREQIPDGAAVGIDGDPWFWSVPLHGNNGGARTESPKTPCRWRLMPDPTQWAAAPPDWLVVNRTHVAEAWPGRWAEFAQGYRLVGSYRAAARVLPGWTERTRGERLHDWNYVLPDIEIYQRAP